VSLDTLGQELKADARVQFATGLVVSEDRVELGRAVVRLADALARGDDRAMAPLLTRRAQGILSDLKTTGAWEESTAKIEAVRVVLLRDGVDLSGIGKAVSSDPTEAIKGAMALLPQAARDMMQPMVDTLPKDDTLMQAVRDQLPGVLEQIKAGGAVTPEQMAEVEKALQPLMQSGESTGSSIGVLLAVQEPGGAYLLGFAAEQVDGGWVFASAPSSPEVRARASAFDGIGNEGFREVTLQSAIAEAPRTAPAADSGSGGGGGGGGGRPNPGGEGAPGPSSPEPPTAPAPSGPGGPGRAPGGG
jgi:hypothetical protein